MLAKYFSIIRNYVLSVSSQRKYNFYHQNTLLDAFRTNSRKIIGRNPSMVIPLLVNQDLTPMLSTSGYSEFSQTKFQRFSIAIKKIPPFQKLSRSWKIAVSMSGAAKCPVLQYQYQNPSFKNFPGPGNLQYQCPVLQNVRYCSISIKTPPSKTFQVLEICSINVRCCKMSGTAVSVSKSLLQKLS